MQYVCDYAPELLLLLLLLFLLLLNQNFGDFCFFSVDFCLRDVVQCKMPLTVLPTYSMDISSHAVKLAH